MALSTAVKEAIWLTNIFSFALSRQKVEPMRIFVDNMGAIKNVEERHLKYKDKAYRHSVPFCSGLTYKKALFNWVLPNNEMVADILTKPLERICFERHNTNLQLAIFPEHKSMWQRGYIGNLSHVNVESNVSMIPESTDAYSCLNILSALELVRYTFHSVSSMSLNPSRAINLYCKKISCHAFRIRSEINQKVW